MTGTNLKTKAKPATETRCLGYARVSTYGQTLDAQLEQLRRDGCTQAYKEKVSGARTDRRQLFRMLKGVAPGGARRGRFVRDSPLEGTGFEPSVPRGKCPTLRVSAVLSAGIRSPCKSQRSGP
jgi:predicted site-specific integrase-resolvase